MKKNKKLLIPVIGISAAFILLAQCSTRTKSPVGPGGTNTSLTVFVGNERGEPIQDVIIRLDYDSRADTTGIEGTAFFEDLPAQTITWTGFKEGCPEFRKTIVARRNQESSVSFTIYSELHVHIRDDCYRIIGNVDITTSPSTQPVRTDENGYTVIRDIPEQIYIFTLTRDGSPVDKKSVVLTGDTGAEIELIVESAVPEVRIDDPAKDRVISTYEIVFHGSATDGEDGELPDSQLVWYSDIDGKLGEGTTLTVDKLKEGVHRIKLEATDSDGKTGQATIVITTVNYDPESFFPLKNDSYWFYTHPEPNFFVINRNNVNELWELKDLTISLDNTIKRTTTVHYDRTVGTLITHCSYVLVDFLETKGNDVYVTLTTEELKEWEKSGTEEKTTMLLRSETRYTPSCLVVPYIADAAAKTASENTVRIETEWYFIYYNIPSATFRESKQLTTTIETGRTNFIQTDKGMFKALEFAILQDGRVRTWWLTRGIGIVRFDYGISTVEQTAVLKDSDLLALYKPEQQAKIAVASGMHSAGQTSVYRLPEDASGAARSMMEILRSMTP